MPREQEELQRSTLGFVLFVGVDLFVEVDDEFFHHPASVYSHEFLVLAPQERLDTEAVLQSLIELRIAVN